MMIVCCTSCSFNHLCYRPDKIPATSKIITITNTTKDSSWVTLINIGDDFQPTFTDGRNNLLPLDYTIESIVFKNAQERNLVGWFFKPKLTNASITVLFLHGNGGNIISQQNAAVRLVKQGFQVFLMDYSGYGFSEGKPTRKGVLADAVAGLKTIRNRGDVKDTKLVVYGQSLGGMLACVASSENEALTDALVMEGAPTSYKDVAAYWYKPIGFLARILIKNEYSPLKSVSNYHKPILVIHSSEDKTAPIRMGRKNYAHANNPKSFYEIKGGHIQGLNYYADSIAARIKVLAGQ
jgi:uncharacterized protein